MEGKQTWKDVEDGTTKYELSPIGEVFININMEN